MIIARIVILMGILAPTLPAWGQVYVPDDSFELFLHSNGHGFGTPDDNLVANSVATISVLDIHDLGIADLTGVQAMTALTELNCANNALTHLSLNQSTLTRLNCRSNAIENLDLRGLTSLRFLDLGMNALTRADLSMLPALQDLIVDHNALRAIVTTANPDLRELNCSFTQVTDLSLAGNTQLQTLRCSDVPDWTLRHLNLWGLSLLSNVDLTNTGIPCIQVDDAVAANNGVGQYTHWMKNIGTTYAQNCSLAFPYTEIPDIAFENRLISLGIDSEGPAGTRGRVLRSDIDGVLTLNVTLAGITSLSGIQDFSALQTLIATNNNLLNLNVVSNPNLVSLQVGSNSIANLDVSNNPNLQVLYANGNRLQRLDVSSNPQLIALRVQTQDAGFLMRDLNLGSTTNLIELRVNGNALGPITRVSEHLSLTTFNAAGNPGLTCIEVDDAAAAATRPGWSKDPGAIYSENCFALFSDGFE